MSVTDSRHSVQTVVRAPVRESKTVTSVTVSGKSPLEGKRTYGPLTRSCVLEPRGISRSVPSMRGAAAAAIDDTLNGSSSAIAHLQINIVLPAHVEVQRSGRRHCTKEAALQSPTENPVGI